MMTLDTVSLRLVVYFTHRFLDEAEHSERKSNQRSGRYSVSILFTAISIYQVADRRKAEGGPGQFHSHSSKFQPRFFVAAIRLFRPRLIWVE